MFKSVCKAISVVLVISLAFTLVAYASSSKYVSADSTALIFSSQSVSSSGVAITQYTAGFNGSYAATCWHLYSLDGNDHTSKSFSSSEGSQTTTKTVYPLSANYGAAHKLLVENYASFSIYVVYDYSL